MELQVRKHYRFYTGFDDNPRAYQRARSRKMLIEPSMKRAPIAESWPLSITKHFKTNSNCGAVGTRTRGLVSDRECSLIYHRFQQHDDTP